MTISQIAKKVTFVLLITTMLPALTMAQSNRDDRRAAKADRKAKKMDEVNKMIRAEEEGTIVYNKEWSMGLRLYNDGWGAFYQKGKMKTVTKTNWWSLEFGERKHPKEEKLSKVDNSGFLFGNPLVYGKQNVFMFTKVGFGQQVLLGGKGNKNGVAVSAQYGGGLTLGLLKPYYVEAADPLTGVISSIRFRGDNSRTDSLFLDPGSVQSRSGLFKGLNETQIVPGVFGRGGFRFDYGRYNELVSALQIGVGVEYYLKEMPIMALNDADKLFVNIYVGIEFGRRK
jgi:hypothetical protein